MSIHIPSIEYIIDSYRFPVNKAHSMEVTKNNMQHRILVPIRAQNSIAAFEDKEQHDKIEENHHLDHG